MLRLKQANFADAAQEYAFVQTIPPLRERLYK